MTITEPPLIWSVVRPAKDFLGVHSIVRISEQLTFIPLLVFGWQMVRWATPLQGGHVLLFASLGLYNYTTLAKQLCATGVFA